MFFLTKIVKEIENRYSVQQDGRLLQYDILTWGKSNTAKKIVLTKPVKEIKWKSILLPSLQIWIFLSTDMLLFWLTNLVSRKNRVQVHTVELLFNNIFIAWIDFKL